jgi:hypothetical protein
MGMKIQGSAVAFTQVKPEEIKPEVKAREVEIDKKDIKQDEKK